MADGFVGLQHEAVVGVDGGSQLRGIERIDRLALDQLIRGAEQPLGLRID